MTSVEVWKGVTLLNVMFWALPWFVAALAAVAELLPPVALPPVALDTEPDALFDVELLLLVSGPTVIGPLPPL